MHRIAFEIETSDMESLAESLFDGFSNFKDSNKIKILDLYKRIVEQLQYAPDTQKGNEHYVDAWYDADKLLMEIS